MDVIKPPNDFHFKKTDKITPTIFLAGSIGVGKNKAEPWQQVRVFNPRRDDWDDSWKQEIENKQFKEQVMWELNALDAADLIAMYFDPKTESPISLLELGLHANTYKLVVCCPKGFWRKGNVDIVCEKYGIPVFEDKKQFIDVLKGKLLLLQASLPNKK